MSGVLKVLFTAYLQFCSFGFTEMAFILVISDCRRGRVSWNWIPGIDKEGRESILPIAKINELIFLM